MILASNRTRQIMKGAKVQLEAHKYKNKPAMLALREIAAGRVRYDRPSRKAVDTYIEELKQRFG